MGKDCQDENKETEEFFMTPCKHRFHKECLLNWMKRKHECPNCRMSLPVY